MIVKLASIYLFWYTIQGLNCPQRYKLRKSHNFLVASLYPDSWYELSAVFSSDIWHWKPKLVFSKSIWQIDEHFFIPKKKKTSTVLINHKPNAGLFSLWFFLEQWEMRISNPSFFGSAKCLVIVTIVADTVEILLRNSTLSYGFRLDSHFISTRIWGNIIIPVLEMKELRGRMVEEPAQCHPVVGRK